MRTSIKSMLVLGGMLVGCAGTPPKPGSLNAIGKQIECRAEALAPYEEVFSPSMLAKMLSGDVDARQVLEAAQEAPDKVEEFIQVWGECEDP
jgi:hypothetical protein